MTKFESFRSDNDIQHSMETETETHCVGSRQAAGNCRRNLDSTAGSLSTPNLETKFKNSKESKRFKSHMFFPNFRTCGWGNISENVSKLDLSFWPVVSVCQRFFVQVLAVLRVFCRESKVKWIGVS